jgi:hypothetical protein
LIFGSGVGVGALDNCVGVGVGGSVDLIVGCVGVVDDGGN